MICPKKYRCNRKTKNEEQDLSHCLTRKAQDSEYLNRLEGLWANPRSTAYLSVKLN